MKYIILALALTATATAYAQAPAPATDGEKLTSSEELALKYVSQEFNQAQQDLAKLNADVSKAHPGYSFNPNTGTLTKNEVPKKKPVTPEVKK